MVQMDLEDLMDRYHRLDRLAPMGQSNLRDPMDLLDR